MAVGTGMGTENKGTDKEEGLSREQQEKVTKAKKPMEIANSFRLFFIFLGSKYIEPSQSSHLPALPKSAHISSLFSGH